ncbi:hypothetical protein KP509_1Z065300 [Ceratopteris richardii]|nr:hypothetical protein KP509_1Z065300 [Ceratopteris richardii]
MLGQLRLLRRCQHVAQGFAQRGYASAQKQGRRQQEASPSPSDSSEKIEWWAVDGELFKAEKFDPKQVLAPLENEHISNKRRRRELARHLAKTRLKFKVHVMHVTPLPI